jgi:hypothetical protein
MFNLILSNISRVVLRTARFSELLAHAGFIVLTILTVFPGYVQAQEEVFHQKVSLPRQNSSIYAVLNQISGQTGYYFVYDTEILNSDKRVRLSAGNNTLATWLDKIIDDPSLDYRIIENHILVYRPEAEGKPSDPVSGNRTELENIIIRGRVLDERSRDPIPYATVGIEGKALGITTNSDGVFTLRLPGEYLENQISVAHLGYKSQHIPVQLFRDSRVDILLETDYISIQEVMIRYYDPLLIVKAAVEKINENYSQDPVYLLNFYREGVQRGNKFINYSEGFFQVYKPPYNRRQEQDQVRLLQSRTISNVDQSDTLILKIRAGIKSSLDLDLIRNIPDFLDMEYIHEYTFTKADIISKDGKTAYAIAFEQKPNIIEPLYKGMLYIDVESLAILGADFEVHPKYIGKAQNQFLTRRNRNYRASVEKAEYTVSYKYYNGRYHLNHVRADLHLRYRKRYQIFSNNYHVFVEMATTRIKTDDVTRLDRKDALRIDKIFVDGNHAYDADFWGGYSIIAPEKQITQALSRVESQIENVVMEKPGN